MNNKTWLESLAAMTDNDINFDKLLKQQPQEVQIAYQSNDQQALKILLGGKEKLACKTTIFQI